MSRPRWLELNREPSPDEMSSSSQAHSTRPILQDFNLGIPNPPFNRRHSSSSSTLQSGSPGFVSPGSPFYSPSRSRNASPAPDIVAPHLSSAESNVSLSVNYIPSKFSSSMLSPAGPRHRKIPRDLSPSSGLVPKMGGGVDAFRSGEARIGGHGDDEDDEDGSRPLTRGHQHRKLRWNKFKWTLFIANLALTTYSVVALIFCLLTWFNVWTLADVVRVGNRSELVLSTLAACAGIFTSVVGWAGIVLNNRSFLATYTFFLWIVFLLMLVPGYLTYKQRVFNLEGKINAQWSQHLGTNGRMRIQNELKCCGYFSPYVEATVTQTCYSRTILPGCKLQYLTFERSALKRWYAIAFGLVPVHIAVIIAGLLCSNHVTYRFGKGMMPKAYRLSMTSMAIIMDNYATQLAEQYGTGVAADILTRSRSNLQLNLEIMPPSPGSASGSPAPQRHHFSGKTSAGDTVFTTAHYDSLSTRDNGAG